MKSDKLEYPYAILNSNHEITDESGNINDSPCFYFDEDSAIDEIRKIYREDSDETGPFYVGKITLISKVFPPTDLKIEKL